MFGVTVDIKVERIGWMTLIKKLSMFGSHLAKMIFFPPHKGTWRAEVLFLGVHPINLPTCLLLVWPDSEQVCYGYIV